MKRLLSLGALAVLAGAALVGCGAAASAASKATPTATCPTTPQFQETTGTITTVSGSQMMVQTTKGAVQVTLSSRTRYTSQQKTAQSDVKDGVRVQVVVKDNGDGTYTAMQVALRQVPATTGTGGNGGNGGNGGFGGGNGGRGGNGTPTPGTGRGRNGGTPVASNCRPTTGRGGGNGGFGGTGTTEGGLPSGSKVLSGTVATINGANMTITGTDGTDYNVKLDSTTIYSKIGAGKVSDLKTGLPVTAIGTKAKDGSLDAQSVTILLALPSTGA